MYVVARVSSSGYCSMISFQDLFCQCFSSSTIGKNGTSTSGSEPTLASESSLEYPDVGVSDSKSYATALKTLPHLRARSATPRRDAGAMASPHKHAFASRAQESAPPPSIHQMCLHSLNCVGKTCLRPTSGSQQTTAPRQSSHTAGSPSRSQTSGIRRAPL